MDEDGGLEDDGMADSGYLESQANNLDPLSVRKIDSKGECNAQVVYSGTQARIDVKSRCAQ